MEERTREKYLRACRLMLHVFEGHRSRLPRSARTATVVAEGMKAAQALGIEAVTRELRCELEQAKARETQLRASLAAQIEAANAEADALRRELEEAKAGAGLPPEAGRRGAFSLHRPARCFVLWNAPWKGFRQFYCPAVRQTRRRRFRQAAGNALGRAPLPAGGGEHA